MNNKWIQKIKKEGFFSGVEVLLYLWLALPTSEEGTVDEEEPIILFLLVYFSSIFFLWPKGRIPHQ